MSVFYDHGMLGGVALQHGAIYTKEQFEGYQKLIEGIEEQSKMTGYFYDVEKRAISPMIVKNPTKESPLLAKKNHGPILPIVTFSDFKQLVSELSPRKDLNSVYFFTNSGTIFNEVKSLIPCRHLYMNSTNFFFNSTQAPDFSSFFNSQASTKGVTGFQTFTKPKVFTVGNKPASLGRFGKILPSSVTNRASRRFILPAATLFGLGYLFL